jgi:transcriptional regulator with XRE-family HTH domain
MQEKNEKNLPNETIGDRLHKIRKDKGLSQAELAEQIGFKQSSTISKIESDRIDPDSNTLKKLAEALDTDLHWLITSNPSPLTVAAINALKPFIYSYLSTITKKIQEKEERCAFIRKDTLFGVTHNMPISHEQSMEFLNLDKEQKKIEDLHTEYKALIDALNEALKPFGEKI